MHNRRRRFYQQKTCPHEVAVGFFLGLKQSEHLLEPIATCLDPLHPLSDYEIFSIHLSLRWKSHLALILHTTELVLSRIDPLIGESRI